MRHILLMAVAFGLCGLAPSYPIALVTLALAGASNAPFFAATLAARSRYAPPQARAQVFVSVAGLKIAASSAGTALAGLCAGAGARALLAGCVGVTLLAAATAAVDRRLSRAGRTVVRVRPAPRSATSGPPGYGDSDRVAG